MKNEEQVPRPSGEICIALRCGEGGGFFELFAYSLKNREGRRGDRRDIGDSDPLFGENIGHHR